MKKHLVILVHILCCILFDSTIAIAQSKKSIYETNYAKGDTIIVPYLDIELLNREKEVENDSVAALLNFLKDHPDLKIELICYTDSKGTAPANLQSSKYRADGIMKFLIKNNVIEKENISANGYGEQYLLYTDAQISLAKSEKEKAILHQKNVRTELIVKDIK
jgi:hypothetical protein